VVEAAESNNAMRHAIEKAFESRERATTNA